jgi:hypothetical protein
MKLILKLLPILVLGGLLVYSFIEMEEPCVTDSECECGEDCLEPAK